MRWIVLALAIAAQPISAVSQRPPLAPIVITNVNVLPMDRERVLWKLVLDGGRAMLFNLRADTGERNNLIGQRSDVARRLRPLLAAWEEDVNAEAKRATSTPSIGSHR